MAGVTEVAILYLIANSIKLHCDYCIFTGNAVPLNTCFDQLNQIDPTSIFKSYKFICSGGNNGILQLDYTNSACLGLPYQSTVLHNIIEYGCSSNNGIICSSDKYVLVDLINAITSYYSEIGYILNKCVSISSGSYDSSKFTQCTSSSLIEWVFDDIACTSLKSIDIYSIGSSYQFPNVILSAINYCPSCKLTLGSYIVRNQVELQVNYIVTNDATYTFPEPMGVCNQFIYNNDIINIASYEYSCDLNGNVYKSIWNNTNCTDLYFKHLLLNENIDYIDYNCDNYINMLSKSEIIQPSSVKLNRYDANINGVNECSANITSDWSQVSYITNYCIQQTEILWIILESHDEFMIIHHYSDIQCQIEISECMILWKTNNCNIYHQ